MGKRLDKMVEEGGPAPLFEMAWFIKRDLYPKVPMAVSREAEERFEEVLAYISFEDGK